MGQKIPEWWSGEFGSSHDDLYRQIAEVLGEDQVEGWVSGQIPALDNRLPRDLIKAGDAQEVSDCITRLDYGIY